MSATARNRTALLAVASQWVSVALPMSAPCVSPNEQHHSANPKDIKGSPADFVYALLPCMRIATVSPGWGNDIATILTGSSPFRLATGHVGAALLNVTGAAM